MSRYGREEGFAEFQPTVIEPMISFVLSAFVIDIHELKMRSRGTLFIAKMVREGRGKERKEERKEGRKREKERNKEKRKRRV